MLSIAIGPGTGDSVLAAGKGLYVFSLGLFAIEIRFQSL